MLPDSRDSTTVLTTQTPKRQQVTLRDQPSAENTARVGLLRRNTTLPGAAVIARSCSFWSPERDARRWMRSFAAGRASQSTFPPAEPTVRWFCTAQCVPHALSVLSAASLLCGRQHPPSRLASELKITALAVPVRDRYCTGAWKTDPMLSANFEWTLDSVARWYSFLAGMVAQSIGEITLLSTRWHSVLTPDWCGRTTNGLLNHAAERCMHGLGIHGQVHESRPPQNMRARKKNPITFAAIPIKRYN